MKDYGLFVKRTEEGNCVAQGTQLPVLLGMNAFVEVVKGWCGPVGSRKPSLCKE